MLLLLMLMLQEGNMKLMGVARNNMSKEESDYTEPCHDLGAVQVECTAHHKCIQQLDMSIRTLQRCRIECQYFLDSDIPCVFFAFEYAVLFKFLLKCFLK